MKIQDPNWGDRAEIEQWARQQIGATLNALPPIQHLPDVTLVMEMLDRTGEPVVGSVEWEGFRGLRGWMRAMHEAMDKGPRHLGTFLAYLTLTLRENNYLRNKKAIDSGQYPADLATGMVWTMIDSMVDCVTKRGQSVPLSTLYDGIYNCIDAAQEDGLSRIPHTKPTEGTVCGGCAIIEMHRRTTTCFKALVAYSALAACGMAVADLPASDAPAEAYLSTNRRVDKDIAAKIRRIAEALLAVPMEGSRDLRPLVDAG